jgi:hypothetical protein
MMSRNGRRWQTKTGKDCKDPWYKRAWNSKYACRLTRRDWFDSDLYEELTRGGGSLIQSPWKTPETHIDHFFCIECKRPRPKDDHDWVYVVPVEGKGYLLCPDCVPAILNGGIGNALKLGGLK